MQKIICNANNKGGITTRVSACRFLLLVSGLALLHGCDNGPSDVPEQQPEIDARAPVIGQVILNRNPNPTVPLAAILSLSTNKPTVMTVRINDGERTWDATSSEGFATEHSLMVLGMRPGRIHNITGVVTDEAGNISETRTLPLEMPPLPEELGPPELLISQPDRMEPGVTMFSLRRIGSDGESVRDLGQLVIVDDRGEVIWYFRNHVGSGDARRINNGNLLLEEGDNLVAEIDMLGNIVRHWHARQADPETVPAGSIAVDTDTFHHEIVELPSGSLLTLSREARVMEDFPTSYTEPAAPSAPATVVGDVIIEFARDGALLRQWSLLDILDPRRIGYGSLRAGNDLLENYSDMRADAPPRDWTHANAVSYDPNDDSFIVSLRSQDAVIKVDRESGELIWILGTHNNWKEPWSDYLLEPQGELEWQYHEHGPEVGEKGSFVMFDNGNGRASAFQEQLPLEERYSRAVEFIVDRDAMTVTQAWDYGGPKGDEWFYSSYISDADWLPVTDNILVTDGGRYDDENGVPRQGNEDGGQRWAQIFEVARSEPAEKVFHIVLKDEPPAGYQVYRAQRLPGLYP